MPMWIYYVAGLLALGGVFIIIAVIRLIHICQPNRVLVFSGRSSRVGDRRYNYKIIKGGGRAVRYPLFNRVDALDLTNMVIDVTAQNAYSKGGVPLTVQAVANVKIAGHEPVLNNAIERFLGRSRAEIMQIAKATLEGSLRGILATLTPEQVNDDKLIFAERLVQDVEEDMTRLGLVVDTLTIQNVADDVRYLDSIGRKRSAEIIRIARIAEAKAKAESAVRSAENREREVTVQIQAKIDVAKADAQRRLTDALTQRNAVVAEEQATVAAALAHSKAEVDVQKARVEQVRGQLEADVVAPAKASCSAAEEDAKAKAAPIIEDGRARAEVLKTLAQSWENAGPNARDVFLLQKLNKIIETVTATVADTHIEKVTMIDSRAPSLGGDSMPMKAISTLEQIKEIFGIDVVDKVRRFGEPEQRALTGESTTEHEPAAETEEQ